MPAHATFRRIIAVDYNNKRADGRLIARQSMFAPLSVGDKVVARDEPEDMEFRGEVTGISDDGKKLYLTMEWI